MEDKDIYELFMSVAEHSGQQDDATNKIRLDLLKIWLDELRAQGHPQVYLS
jgi:hypothetical protein